VHKIHERKINSHLFFRSPLQKFHSPRGEPLTRLQKHCFNVQRTAISTGTPRNDEDTRHPPSPRHSSICREVRTIRWMSSGCCWTSWQRGNRTSGRPRLRRSRAHRGSGRMWGPRPRPGKRFRRSTERKAACREIALISSCCIDRAVARRQQWCPPPPPFKICSPLFCVWAPRLLHTSNTLFKNCGHALWLLPPCYEILATGLCIERRLTLQTVKRCAGPNTSRSGNFQTFGNLRIRSQRRKVV